MVDIGKIIFRCPICGKELPSFFQGCPRTYKYTNNGMRTVIVCNEECLELYEKDFFVEEYKGNKIYKILYKDEVKYIPYMGATYGFDTVEDCKKRIDMKNIGVINQHIVKRDL